MGPMTGGRRGVCAGYRSSAYTPVAWPVQYGAGGSWAGYGGQGGFGGRGRRNWYRSTGMPGWARAGQGMPAWGGFAGPSVPWTEPSLPKEQELEALKRQAEYFEGALTAVKKSLDELKGSPCD